MYNRDHAQKNGLGMKYKSPARRVDKIAFGKPTHYYVDADNRRIPGVTTILSNGLPKPALVNWAANSTAAYAVDNWEMLQECKPSERFDLLKKARYEDRDQAARRGTEIHNLAEQLTLGQTVIVPDELRGHVEAYIGFLDDWKPEPVLTERTVISYTHGYAGTLDLIYRLPDGTTVLADIKTSRSGIYGETALQLAAYRYADVYLDDDGTEQPVPGVDETHAIWIRADGYSVYPMNTSKNVFDDFRRVMQTANVIERLNAYKGSEIHTDTGDLA